MKELVDQFYNCCGVLSKTEIILSNQTWPTKRTKKKTQREKCGEKETDTTSVWTLLQFSLLPPQIRLTLVGLGRNHDTNNTPTTTATRQIASCFLNWFDLYIFKRILQTWVSFQLTPLLYVFIHLFSCFQNLLLSCWTKLDMFSSLEFVEACPLGCFQRANSCVLTSFRWSQYNSRWLTTL